MPEQVWAESEHDRVNSGKISPCKIVRDVSVAWKTSLNCKGEVYKSFGHCVLIKFNNYSLNTLIKFLLSFNRCNFV